MMDSRIAGGGVGYVNQPPMVPIDQSQQPNSGTNCGIFSVSFPLGTRNLVVCCAVFVRCFLEDKKEKRGEKTINQKKLRKKMQNTENGRWGKTETDRKASGDAGRTTAGGMAGDQCTG